jgi:hypothetical protein
MSVKNVKFTAITLILEGMDAESRVRTDSVSESEMSEGFNDAVLAAITEGKLRPGMTMVCTCTRYKGGTSSVQTLEYTVPSTREEAQAEKDFALSWRYGAIQTSNSFYTSMTQNEALDCAAEAPAREKDARYRAALATAIAAVTPDEKTASIYEDAAGSWSATAKTWGNIPQSFEG